MKAKIETNSIVTCIVGSNNNIVLKPDIRTKVTWVDNGKENF